MIEITIDDLPDWYSSKVRKKIEPTRKKVQKVIERIQLVLSDIISACDKLSDTSTISERDELASKSIEQLAKKYQEHINELEIPTEPLSFEKVTKFSSGIKNLIQYLAQQGRRWVPKLHRTTGQTYKANIRELNYHLRSLQDEWINLEGFIEKKFKQIKIYEDIFGEFEKVINTLDEIEDKKDEMKTVESELNELNERKKELEEKYNTLLKTPLIAERTKFEKELSAIVQNLKTTLGYFRKPFRKFLKLLGEGNYFVRPGCNENLLKYIDNPLETFFEEQDDYSNLKMVLLELKKAASRLSLKSRDEKKLIKEIDDINDGSLAPYRQQYKQFYKQFQENAKKLDEAGHLAEIEEVENKISILDKDISDAEQKYSRMKDNYEKNLIKIRDLRVYIENAIKSTTKEEVKIIL